MALTSQQRKFKSAAASCKPVLYRNSGGGKGPSRNDWKSYGSCMSGELRGTRRKARNKRRKARKK